MVLKFSGHVEMAELKMYIVAFNHDCVCVVKLPAMFSVIRVLCVLEWRRTRAAHEKGLEEDVFGKDRTTRPHPQDKQKGKEF